MENKWYDGVEKIEILDCSGSIKKKFLHFYVLKLRHHYKDGKISQEYTYEASVRRNLDAVAVICFSKNHQQPKNPTVFLRKTFRPPLLLRTYRETIDSCTPPTLITPTTQPLLLEVAAGILEDGDQTLAAIENRAVAEVWEEFGFRVRASSMIHLGSGTFPTPGLNPEKILLYAAEILDPSQRQPPPTDGSPTEEVAGFVEMPLHTAIEACVKGDIADAKTEICLHRLQKVLEKKT